MEEIEAEEETNRSKRGEKKTISESSHQNNNEDNIPQKGQKNKAGSGNWIDFYSTTVGNKDSQLSKFLTLKMLESSNFSPKFIDFLRECLMFDPKDRMKAFDLLSHPVFRKYNKIYISQQIVMTKPITRVEKHNL